MQRRVVCVLVVVSASLVPACSTPRSAPPDTGASADGAAPGDDAASLGEDARVPAETRLAAGVTLEGLALFQGTRVALFAGGVPAARNAPIVASRAAVLRAYVDPGTRVGQPLTGELEVREGERVSALVRASFTPGGVSDDATPGSVLAFDVPAEAVTQTARFAVRIVDPGGEPAPSGAPHVARLPRDGSLAALEARSDGAGLQLVLVPLRWDHDGSGRLPDTSAAQLQTFRDLLLAVYPLAHLAIEVHDPVPWDDALTFTGNVDFGAVNAMLMTLRASEGAASSAYYYALVNADDTYDAYCGGGCVTGQSFVTDAPEDADYRVGSGVGFPGQDTAWTLAHELGHEHGRTHAPCDAGGADPDFPYGGGGIGVWGLDPRTGAFQDPATLTDFMGYCDPTWTSDYTWSAIFERTVAVAALTSSPRSPSLLVRVGGEAGARVAGVATLRSPHATRFTLGRWLDARGRTIALVRAPAVTQSHTDEQLAVFPLPPAGATALEVNGLALALDL